jgi:hypothetical protein
VTNRIINNQVVDRYWNTKQKIGQPDSVDAESLEVAKFKDGYYWVIDLCRFKYNEIGGLK